MTTHETLRYQTRREVVSWINDSWNTKNVSCIKNTWRSGGQFFPGEFGDPTISESDDDVANIPMIVGISRDDYGGEDSGGEDDGVEY
jgi:hypothetical protein